MRSIALALGLTIATESSLARAQNATTPGELASPYPTFHNLSIEWAISGDANGNATATARFGKPGDASKQNGLPLSRVLEGTMAGHNISNKLVGSLFGLEPGTSYDIEVSLTDPDGGSATRQLTVATRSLPTVPSAARSIPVDPTSVAAALGAARPGDVIELSAGSYSTLVVPSDGTKELPIVVRASSPSGVVVQGDVRLDGRSHVWLEGLTVKGKIKCNDGAWLVIRGCTIDTPDFGIVAYGTGVSNSYIANNVISGATQWAETSLGVDGNNLGEGIQITGPGNVIAFNRIKGFRDCVSLLEEDEASMQTSIDIYGNDLSVCADDGIEADYSMGNVRVYQNRIANSFMGISSQPSLGGPTYFVRNALYNVIYEPFKLHNGSRGDVILHNTVVKSGDALIVATDDPITRATFRNNLLLGGPGGTYNGYATGEGNVMMLASADSTCSLDYDGFGTTSAAGFTGRLGTVRFSGVSQMNASTTEVHGVDVGNAPFAANVPYPADPFHAPVAPSLVLAASSLAVDRGTVLANLNDGFAGSAPDLGAYELGHAEPKYGPNGDLGAASGGTAASGGVANASTGVGNPAGSTANGGGASRWVASGGTGANSMIGGSTSIVASATTGGADRSDQGIAGSDTVRAGSDSGSSCTCRAVGTRPNPSHIAIWLGLIGVAASVRRIPRRTGQQA